MQEVASPLAAARTSQTAAKLSRVVGCQTFSKDCPHAEAVKQSRWHGGGRLARRARVARPARPRRLARADARRGGRGRGVPRGPARSDPLLPRAHLLRRAGPRQRGPIGGTPPTDGARVA